ncbi:hypothetical protein Tco_1537277, partial [Tanacetum coccineum]
EDEDEEDEEEEEEEENLAPVDSAVVVSTVELVSPPEGTEPIIPPPFTDITTTRARITVRLQASISLPQEAEVERLLAMPTLPPSPPISLSPPSIGEHLARCMALPAHSSPPPVPSPLLPSFGCPTQIQTLRIASTQALVDAVTAALPLPPLPPLPLSLYIPPPVDRMWSGRVLLLGLPEVEGYTMGLSAPKMLKRDEEGLERLGMVLGILGWIQQRESVPEKSNLLPEAEVNTRVTSSLLSSTDHDTHD